MDYGKLFRRAWEICWNNKYIFVLGFLAALGSGGSGGGQSFSSSFSGEELPPEVFGNMDRILALIGPIVAVLICIGLILAVVFWLIRLVAQAGLISTTARIDRGEQSSLGQALSAGTAHLPRFLGLNLLIYLPFWILGIVSVAIAIFAFGATIASAFTAQGGEELGALPAGFALVAICMLALACLLIPLWVLASIVYAFAQRGIVLQGQGVTESIGQSWRFLRNNAGEIILLIVFLIVLSLVFGGLVGVILIPLSFLAFGPAFINLFTGAQFEVIDVITIIGGAILLGVVGAVLNSILIGYRSVAVTLAYHELLNKPVEKLA